MSNLPDAAERAAVWRYVHELERVGNDLHTTSFRAALRDARKLAGRNIDTGIIENDPIAAWPYAHMYLILMDQGRQGDPPGVVDAAHDK